MSTLHESLKTVTLLMAPFTPFITDRVWGDMFAQGEGEPESVHLAAWPQADLSLVKPGLSDHVSLVRRLVELGRAARAESKVKTRQPLRRALVAAPGWQQLPPDLLREITAELSTSCPHSHLIPLIRTALRYPSRRTSVSLGSLSLIHISAPTRPY